MTLGALALAGRAWAVDTATPGADQGFGWRDAITFGIAVLGAVLGVLNLLLGEVRERWKRKASSTYLAMRLAIVLEAYADACADLLSRNETAEHEVRGELPDWEIQLPALRPFPEDSDGWKAIDPNIAGRCLSFSNKIKGSQDAISEMVEHNWHAIGRVVEMHASERGIEAWKLAETLRKTHRLRPLDLVFKYNDYLIEVHAKAQEAEEKRNKRAADLLNEPI